MKYPILLIAAEEHGLDAVDAEIVQWIQDGFFDEAVEHRAYGLGAEPPETAAPVAYFQDFHSAFHKDGPYGYEFCSRCDDILRKFK